MAELDSLDALGGVVGDTFEGLEIKTVFEDGVYLWVQNTDAVTITPAEMATVYQSGFIGQVPDSLAEIAENIPANAASFILFQGDMSKPVPPNFLMTPQSTFFNNSDFSSPNAALPEIPVGCDTAFFYIRIPRTTGSNSWGASAPQLTDVGTTWRNGRQIRRVILERNELTSDHQIALVQSIEREILAGMGVDYTVASDTVRFIDFQSASSGANDPLNVADMEAIGWTVDTATTMGKTIDGDNWRVLHN